MNGSKQFEVGSAEVLFNINTTILDHQNVTLTMAPSADQPHSYVMYITFPEIRVSITPVEGMDCAAAAQAAVDEHIRFVQARVGYIEQTLMRATGQDIPGAATLEAPF